MSGAAVVIGAGDATGGAVAAAFARDGLVAVPVRRTWRGPLRAEPLPPALPTLSCLRRINRK